MAGYSGNSLRAVQKKLRKIVKDVTKSESFQSILDSVDDSDPHLEFMFEDDAIDQFGDNAHSFKAAADAAWIFIAKTDGLKQHAEQVSLLCASLLRQEFPDQEFEDVPVTKKRGRASVDKAPASPVEKSPPRKKTVRKEEAAHSTAKGKKAVVDDIEEEEVEVTITSADKTALKGILTKLSKDPDAEYFLYPVDAEAYPEYFEHIQYPMDLATVKSKLGEYRSVGEALSDLRVIWDNCRAFNAEGSDILNSAENCSALLETLVQEKFPSEVLVKKKGRKSKAPADEPLAAPVTVKIEKVVKTEKVDKDEPKPSAKKAAKRKRATPSHTIVQEGWPVNPRTLVQVPEGLALSRSTMKTLLREVTNSDFADPFLDAVDPDEAPGYEDLIATPMDLTTMRKRITAGTYDNDAGLFAKETRLVWENCVLYNDPASEIALFAAKLGELFETQLAAVLEQMVEEEEASSASAVEVEAPAPTLSTPKNKPGRKPKVVEEDEEEKINVAVPRKTKDAKDKDEKVSTKEAAEEEAEAKKPASVPMKKMRKILREIYKMDLSLPFQEPVPVDEVPGYREMISTPMDLSTVKAQLSMYEEAPGKFLRDMRLIFDNCQKFNIETSELYKTAGTLRDAVDRLYCEAFPPVDAAEELAAAQKAAAKAARKAKQEGKDQDVVMSTNDDDYRPRAGSTASSFVMAPASVAAPVVQVLPTVLPPTSGTSAAALASRLPTKPEELEALEKALSEPGLIPSSNSYVRDRAMLKARDKLKAAKVPYVVAPDLYTVQSFGEIQGTHEKYRDHDEYHLYPLGYCVSRKMRIALLPAHSGEEEVALKGRPFVDVDLKCKIGFSYSGNPDIFHVLLENGTAISQGPTAAEAWAAIIGKEQRVMRSLGGKLQRCRAVFNRLAVSPDALPFLDMVPLTGPVGEQYYAIIKSPMWFREVHTRLVEGTYDVEFDFAWDMRLIFKNCMEYNLAGSELYEAAERLGEAFEQLFTRWVLNTQDGTTEDVAKGPWDRWMGLKYFDYEDPTINICAETGTRGPASQMLQCRCCEDQNLATLHPAVTHKSDWACPRCVEALQWCSGDLTNSPFSSYANPSTRYDPYSIEEFGGSAFVPAPEFGLGWSQAKRRLPFAGLKNLFLSPLGYEVVKEQIADQAAYEQIVNQNLYAARAVEFQEFAKTHLLPRGGNSKKKTARHRRSTTEPMSPEKASAQAGQSSSTAAPAIDPAAAEEEGRIPTGKLYNFAVPEDSQLVWLVCSNEALALEKAAAGQDIAGILAERVPLTADLLPETGFFGLHLPAIRARVEGVPGAANCAEYRFQDEEKHRDDILKEVRNIRKRLELMQASSDTLRKTILEERYRFDRKLLTPPVPTEIEATNSMEHKKDFFPLFPPTVESSQADALLCLWEFLYLTPSLAKHIEVYSLHDLVCSLAPPTSALATYGQIVFDEVCCSLADLLLGDLRHRCDLSFRTEAKWQEVLLVRPVNIITWPEVALESLRLINFPLSAEEMGRMLTAPSLSTQQLLQRDLLTLVFNHPLIDTFLALVAVPEGHAGPDPNVIATALRQMKDHFSSPELLLGVGGAEGIFLSAETLCSELRRLFLETATTDSNPQRLLHSRSIVLWLDGLCARWAVSVDSALPEDFPTLESLTPALHAEKLNPWRFWGGYTLSNLDLPRAQVLLPSDFSMEVLSDYERRIQALEGLEKTLQLFGRSEPESWTADQRATIFLTFIDHGVITKDSLAGINQRQANVNHKCGRLHDVPATPPSAVPHFDVVKHSPPGTKCHFTGVEVDHSLEGTVWLSVPIAYQTGPASEAPPAQPAATSNGRGTRGSTVGCVALQSALLNVVAAREVAVRDARYHENRVMTVLQPTLYENAKTCALQKQLSNRIGADLQRSASYPSQPLGYDRKGNAYWLLTVQEASTLFPFHPNGVPLFMAGSVNPGLPDGKMSVEPCVLIREPSGWWGFHNFGEINALLGSFSSELPCERILLLKLIEKLAYTRCWLSKNALNVRIAQREWVVKRIRAEHAIHGVKFPAENLAPLQMNRFLEMVWSRCVEVRQYLHINAAYRFEEDSPANSIRAEKDLVMKRAKRLREIVGDDIFQLHHSKGFQRNDLLVRLRQTAATTTATQIIADSAFYPMLVDNAKKSPFLQRNDPMAPPLPVTRGQLLIAGANGEDGSAVSAAEESKAASGPGAASAPDAASGASEPMDVEAPAADPTGKDAEPVKQDSAEASTIPSSEPMEVDAASAAVVAAPAPAEDPESHLLDPSTLIVDLRGFINSRFGNTNDFIKTKAIEVVHLVTGELLRVFQSGKDAAAFFNVSQSGISLCLHNTKPYFLG